MSLLPALGLAARLIADESFISFDCAASAAKQARVFRLHGFADTVRHEPSSLVGHVQRALQLLAAHTLLGRAKQVRGQHPGMERYLGTFEHRPNGHSELSTAVSAGVYAFAVRGAVQFVIALRSATVWAYRTIRPTDGFKVLAGRVFVGKARFCESGGHGASPKYAFRILPLMCLSSI